MLPVLYFGFRVKSFTQVGGTYYILFLLYVIYRSEGK